MKKLIYPFLALLLAAVACSVPTAVPISTFTPGVPVIPTPTDTTAPLPQEPTPTYTSPSQPGVPTNTTNPPQPGAQWTLDTLKNATYHAPSYDRTVTLVNGTYTESSGGYSYTVAMPGPYAFGDLNGDGKADAAVILAENGGGSGSFVSLVVLINENGQPKQTGETQLGDRELVKTVDISSNVIHLDMVVHQPNDGLCCPSLPEKRNYWLFGKLLFLMKLTSTPADTERVVAINSPGHWSTQNNPFTVEGSVTVLPFENTLGWKIYTIDGKVASQGTIQVSPTVGTAGVFSHQFDLTGSGIKDWFIVQFFDTSPADGSIIALGSVIMQTR